MSGWRNWAGNQTCTPARTVAPGSVDEVVAAVRAARRDGLTVKAAGTGHSFTAAAATDGVQLLPHRMRGIRSIDQVGRTVTVEQGTPLAELNAALAAAGFGLRNMGDIAVQTVAGATATGTHGTGRTSASISQQVVGVELVLADGSVVACGPGEDLFEAARLGLGALGVVTALTFAIEPAFLLHAVEAPLRWEDVLSGLAGLTEQNEHFEFHWFPHTDVCLTKRNNRSAGPSAPLSRARYLWEDEAVSNGVFGAYTRLARRFPALAPHGNKLSGVLLSAREYTAPAPDVFASPRRVRFIESEYAVPRAAVEDVLRELRSEIDRNSWKISFPVEVRFAPADDVWLSTAYGRDTAYVAIHQYAGSPGLADYFPTAERIFTAAGGRPHWGKLHTRSASYLSDAYPKFADFVRVRDEVDPERRFANEYLDRVLTSP